MTNTELFTQIDAAITDKTEAGSISPADIGDNMGAVVDYVDQEIDSLIFVYKAVLVQTGSGAITTNVIANTFPTSTTFTFSVLSTGTYTVNVPANSNLTLRVSNNANTKNVKTSGFILNSNSAQFKQIDLSGTPVDSFTDLYIEIRPLNQ